MPPFSAESERGVLGSILQDGSRCLDVGVERGLLVDAFYVPAHRHVFEAIADLAMFGMVVDLLTVGQALRDAGRLDAVGGTSFLDKLIDDTPTTAHFEFYLEAVLKKWRTRQAIQSARELEASLYEGDEDLSRCLADHVTRITGIDSSQKLRFEIPWKQTISDRMKIVEECQARGRCMTGISTGFVGLDNMLLGLQPAELYVLAARPSMGKTSLAMNIAENVCRGKMAADGKGRSVGVFSLEMNRDSLAFRMMCCAASVNSRKIMKGYISREELQRMVFAAGELSQLGIYVDDDSIMDIGSVRIRAKRMREKHGVELIVLDYLQLMRDRDSSKHGRQTEVAAISGGLKSMAKELHVPVLVVSQLNRGLELRDKTGRPRMADLRDSGAIEQDADTVMLLHRPCKTVGADEREDQTLAIVDVAKQRSGPTGDVRMNFDEEFTRFRDRQENGPEEEQPETAQSELGGM
jgi:replicative DNA helicase